MSKGTTDIMCNEFYEFYAQAIQVKTVLVTEGFHNCKDMTGTNKIKVKFR